MLNGHSEKFLKNVKINKIEEEISKLVKKTNANLQEKIKYVDFDEIDEFIDSVVLNPFAPEWFNETLKAFCDNNKLRYLGKSTLYNGC